MLTSCTETKTSDAQDAYRYWAGMAAPEEVKVTRGQYWQSAHFTREYVVYLDLTASPRWSREYIRQNNLIPDNGTARLVLAADAPGLFTPDSTFIRLQSPASNGRYYWQPQTGKMLIYEEQF